MKSQISNTRLCQSFSPQIPLVVEPFKDHAMRLTHQVSLSMCYLYLVVGLFLMILILVK